MSGVYISGMEMPTSCYLCQCNKDDGFGFFTCGVTHSECEFLSRPDDCPLVPVQPHGRLIDADALAEMLEKCKKEYALKAKEDIVHLHKAWGLHDAELMAESLPTIIPADKEGEE